MKKLKTNEQIIRALVKEISDSHPFLMAIFRERLISISETTREGVAKNPEGYDNPMFNHTWYTEWCNIMDKHLG